MSDRNDGSFQSLDELLDLPFERIETELKPTPLERLESLGKQLQELDDELTEYLERNSCTIQ
ncbi:MAG: hypothetical protein ACOC45_05305 [Alkalispirochaetaceae bacterium]